MHNNNEIDPEDVLYPLMEIATRPFMPRPNGKQINRCTILKAKEPRADGRHLRTSKFAGRYYTCDRWLRDYMDRDSVRTTASTKPLTVAQRARRERAIDRELAAAGI